MSNLKKLAGQTAIYGLSSILARSINFLMIFIYTSYLNREVVGSFTGIYALIGFLNIIFTYGMETSFFRFSTGKNLDPKKVYNTTQSLLITTTLIFGSGVFLAAPWLAEVMDYPNQAYLFRWTALILSFDAILAIPFAKLRLTNRAIAFAGAKMINILLNVFFNLLLIVWIPILISNGTMPASFLGYNLEWGVEYILLANLFANGLIIPYVWWIAGFFRFSLDKEILRPMWNYAIPLLFMGLAGVTNELVSRLSFEYLLPENFYPGLNTREAAGIFGTSIKLAILMNLVIQAFKYAAEPFFFGKAADKNSPQLYAQVMHAFIIFCSALMIVISVNLDLVALLFPKNKGYDSAFFIVPVLLMGYLLLGIYFNLSIWFKITDKTNYSFWITLVGAIVSLIAVFTLVPILGYLGGALSTLMCYLVMTGLCYYFGQKHFPIPYQTGKGILYLLLAFGLSYAGFYFQLDSFLLSFIAKNSLIFLFILVIGFSERAQLIEFLKRKQLR
ncbi:lipopolysaccharide biosynthesis protein [Algoriphagus boritolerans]|uniref:Membrane protein involved in the export of O-antigen and teichoic acid n=1 Tax=Algoriphagus boritolerans DSM 17298 = JCM 18970 TaxID=1120964 RepID=A0A1H5X6V8_9BACT|nr:polysaccharide biosynthesis C-terminal domain-containing protein [Algoriphagus boritolerans]SEG07120.1 Membrane protein involved in the export of O-antigen and teichoic acid [Algoriphagus boritolerans DSM 17298 = JCM 18970]